MPDLARFQAELLEVLKEGRRGEDLQAWARDRHPEYAPWVAQFDDRSLHVAHRILQRWLRKRE